MGLFDNFRNLGSRRRIGLELGRRIAAVEVKGDPPEVTAAGQSVHAGYSGAELGSWLKRWLETAEIEAKSTRAVVVDGNVYHYLVDMPSMSDSERHLAAGAEVRKLAPVPAQQLAYGHVAVGSADNGRDRVLISAIDKSTLANVSAAVEAAGLNLELVTTVPAALARTIEMLPSRAGGQAIAWLGENRSYLLVHHNGSLELVRDFAMREVAPEADPEAAATAIAAEMRRSFLYFGQRVHGASVDRLVLAGPLANLGDVAVRLQDALGIRVELFDVSDRVDLGEHVDEDEQPAFAAALGAAALASVKGANLVPPEQVTEKQVERATSIGAIAAGVLLLLLLGWGILALLSASVTRGSLADTEQRLTAARDELQQAREWIDERTAHRARRAMLENRALESTLLGAALQRLSMRIPDEVVFEQVTWQRAMGPDGMPYWDANIRGLVLGESRSESQAIFNRFWTLLVNDPLIDDMHLVQPLVIGNESARTVPELTSAVRQDLSTPQRVINPLDGAAAGSQNFDRQRTGFESQAGRAGRLDPGSVIVRTTIDDLPPFGPTENSVSFNFTLELKGIDSGGER